MIGAGMTFIDTFGSNGERTGVLNVAKIILLAVEQQGVDSWMVMAEGPGGYIVQINAIPLETRQYALDWIDDQIRRW